MPHATLNARQDMNKHIKTKINKQHANFNILWTSILACHVHYELIYTHKNMMKKYRHRRRGKNKERFKRIDENPPQTSCNEEGHKDDGKIPRCLDKMGGKRHHRRRSGV